MMKLGELIMFLISLYFEYAISTDSVRLKNLAPNTTITKIQPGKPNDLSSFPSNHNKLKEVKTIRLEKANHSNGKGKNMPLNLTGLNMAKNATKIQADEPDELSSYQPYPIKLKEVKTIRLEKAHHGDGKGSGNVPWKLTGVDVTPGGPEDVSRFNYETLWNNGLLTLTLVRFEKQTILKTKQQSTSKRKSFYYDEPENFLESSSFSQSDVESVIPDFLRRRFRRRIFGRDSRTHISRGEFRKIPFSAIVKISTGCTGTLISSLHVLTSAHCVHDSHKYIVNVSDVKVGLPKHNGKMRWARVKNIKVPRGWITDKDVRYDYAVLRLVHRHRRKFLVPGSISLSRGHITTHFLGFHQDKPVNSLWYSFCKARLLDHVIINRCDAMPGSSGAGVYVLSGIGSKTVRFIVGVLSGSGTVQFRSGRPLKRFNIVTKLTPLKAAQICSWAKSAPYCNAMA